MNDLKNVSLPQEGGGVPQKALSGPKIHITAKGGILHTGTGNQKRDEGRFNTAKALVEAGVNPTDAMRRAGYADATARQSSGKYPVKKALLKVRDRYLMAYVRQIKSAKLDGKSVAQRLGEIVHKKDDYNAVQAIKAHTMILLKNAPNGDEGSGFLGVFVVPAPKGAQDWQKHAQSLQAVNVPSMIQDAEIIEK